MDSTVLIVGVIVVVLVLIFSSSKRQSSYVPVIYLCTKSEANLFRQLNKKLPEHYHLASKVRLADVCLPRNRKDIGLFNRVAQKHLDFVVVDAQTQQNYMCDRTGRCQPLFPLCAKKRSGEK